MPKIVSPLQAMSRIEEKPVARYHNFTIIALPGPCGNVWTPPHGGGSLGEQKRWHWGPASSFSFFWLLCQCLWCRSCMTIKFEKIARHHSSAPSKHWPAWLPLGRTASSKGRGNFLSARHISSRSGSGTLSSATCDCRRLASRFRN